MSSESKASSKSAYTNTNDHIYFKSNKQNGYAFLSSFYPDVDEKAKQAVYDLFDLSADDIEQAELPFIVDDKEYKTREHYYQSEKWQRYPLIAEDIRTQPTAVDAKKRNTFWKHQLEKRKRLPEQLVLDTRFQAPTGLTEDELLDIMYQGAYQQYRQNPVLSFLLLSTENQHLSEIPGRSGGGLWAAGPTGQDRLGEILEQIRDNLLVT